VLRLSTILFFGFFALTLCSFRFDASRIEGGWVCNTKSGNWDEYTSYQLNCGGGVIFKADHTVESTTSDAMLPTGTRWQVEGNQLNLFDSKGNRFMSYEIKHLDDTQLLLLRKDVLYAFNREK
ncbi:MAG TPA: hypothetical protein PKL15_11065, partial [Saprospiraceae bacterium]|nr:hypothetical protein [Saprospiraceae bacterium]